MARGLAARRVLLACATIAAVVALLVLLLRSTQPPAAPSATGVLTRASAVTDERAAKLATEGDEHGVPPESVSRETPSPELLNAGANASSAALAAGGVVRGRVADETGNAVAGADIWLADVGHHLTGAVVTTTDAHGRFELRDVLEGRRVAARARGFAESASHRVLERNARELLEIIVRRPCGRVLGRVHGDKDVPIAGARVAFGHEQGWELTEEPTDVVRDGPPRLLAVTDAEGRFVFESVPPGRDTLEVRAAGFAPLERSVSVTSAADATVDVAMKPECVVEGIVTDSDDRPVEGADVRCLDSGLTGLSRSTSDERGFYRLGELPPGMVTMEARHSEAGELRLHVQCEPGAPTLWNPVLVAGPLLTGVVLDRRGQALARAIVVVTNNENPPWQQDLRCDERGAFTLRWSHAGDLRLAVTAEHGWLPVLELEDQELWEGERVFIAGWAEGAGNTLRGRLMRDGAAWGPPLSVRVMSSLGLVDRAAFAEADADGSFSVPDLPDGRFTMLVRSGSVVLVDRSVELAGGQVVDLGELRVRDDVGALTVRPRLMGFTPAAPDLAFLEVKLVKPDGSFVCWMLQRNAAFRTDAAFAGEYAVELSGEGIATSRTPLTIVAGRTTELDVDVVPGKRVSLTSCGRAYEKGLKCTVAVLGPLGVVVTQGRERVSKDGCLHTVAWLAPGSYTFEVHADSGLLHGAAFVVTAQPEQKVALDAP